MKQSFFGVQFVPVAFALLDSRYFRKKVGKDCLMTYIVLRRYVWRRESKKSFLDKLYRNGQLVACVGMRKLADVLRISTGTVSNWVKKLEELGWIKVESVIGRPNVYHLGTNRVDENEGEISEVYFADMMIGRELAVERDTERKNQREKDKLMREDLSTISQKFVDSKVGAQV